MPVLREVLQGPLEQGCRSEEEVAEGGAAGGRHSASWAEHSCSQHPRAEGRAW